MIDIDYILVNEKARRMVRDMWMDEKGHINVLSDHSIMVLHCVTQGHHEEGDTIIKTAAGK